MQLTSVDLGIKNFSLCKLEINLLRGLPEIRQWCKIDLTDSYDIDSFSSREIAKVAYDLAEKLIYGPNHEISDVILIEQQRARTMGSHQVQEWTLRVNMLGHMLYSSISTMCQMKRKYSNIQVMNSNPRTMANYWTFDDKKNPKKNRVALVDRWLLTNSIPVEFLDMLKESGKKDDLVDSFLHGVSWFYWTKNKRQLYHTLTNSPQDLILQLESIEQLHLSLLQKNH